MLTVGGVNTPSRPSTAIKMLVVGAFVASALSLLAIGLAGDSLLYFYVAYAVGSVCALILLAVGMTRFKVQLSSLQAIGALFAIGLAIRVFLAVHGPQLSFDPRWYSDYVTFLRDGAVPYGSTFYFPYPQGFLDYLTAFTHVGNPELAIHASLIIVDCLVGVCLYLLLEAWVSPSTAFWAALAYDVLPMPALETGRIGHFETLISLCLVILLYALASRRAFLAAFLVGVATAIKAFPILAIPALAYTWTRKRDLLWSMCGFVTATVLTVAPFYRNINGIISYWTGRSGSAPSQAGSFVANSIPALVADLPQAHWLLPTVEAAGLLLLFAPVLYTAARSRRRRRVTTRAASGPHAGRVTVTFSRGLKIATARRTYGFQIYMREARSTLRRPGISRPLARLSFLALFAIFGIYGAYMIVKPWMPSNFAYPWWSPTPLTIGIGLALVGFSAVGIYCFREDRFALREWQQIALPLAAALTLFVLLHGNVYPWYLMPVIALLLGTLPSRASIAALACFATFYACSFNSTSFRALGWNDVIAAPAQWRVSKGPVPTHQPAGAVSKTSPTSYHITLNNSVRGGFLLISFPSCAPADVAFTLQTRSGTTQYDQAVLNNSAILYLAPHTNGAALTLRSVPQCKPRVSLVAAGEANGYVAIVRDSVKITMRAQRLPGGWAPSISVWSPTFAWALPNTALAFNVIGDTDPTFHHRPLAVSAAVSGNLMDQAPSGNVQLLADDLSASNVGPIRYRFPVFDLTPPLNSLSAVAFGVKGVQPDGKPHTIAINGVHFANEARWGIWTAQATAMVASGVLLCVACLFFCLGLSWKGPKRVAELRRGGAPRPSNTVS